MPKYNVPAGDLVDMLMEECAEVIQAIGKLRRFGPEGTKQWLDEDRARLTPRQQVIQELGDVVAVATLLQKYKWMTHDELNAAVDRKYIKLELYFGLRR